MVRGGIKLRQALVLFSLAAIILAFQNCDRALTVKSDWEVSSNSPSDLGPGFSNLDGAGLYSSNCVLCHGALANSSIGNRDTESLTRALSTVSAMDSLRSKLSSAEIAAISKVLLEAQRTPLFADSFACQNEKIRGASETVIRRLSRDELVNTLTTVFGSALVGRILSLALYPTDVMLNQVTEFRRPHAFEHIESVYEMSLEIAKSLSSNRTDLNAVAPTCVGQGIDANNISDACLTQYISSLGEKLHRRPLSSARITDYLNTYKSTSPLTTGFVAKDRFELLTARLLQAPEFLFHTTGTSGQVDTVNRRVKVDAFTVANRLAYQLTAYPPDQTLYDAAKNGTLNTLAQVEAQARRLIQSQRGRERVKALFHHWLKLDKVFAPPENVMSRLGLSPDATVRNRLKNELVTELKEYIEQVIFEQNGTFADLMLSDLAVPRSGEMATILGLNPASRGPVRVANSRRGLMMRPALLAGTGNDRESPINRGVRMRLRVLCEVLPPPPADADDAAQNALSAIDPNTLSMRDVAKHVTGATSCMNCHRTLNSLGYALSSFGPLGEFRTSEKIFGTNNQVLREFPVDAKVTEGVNLVSASDSVKDHVDMADLASRSPVAQACMARFAFRFSRLRMEQSQDACQMAEATQMLKTSQPVQQALVKSVASEDIFWRGITP